MVVCRCILAQQGWHSVLIRSLEDMEERGSRTGFTPELHEVFLNAMLCRLAFFELNVHLCCTRLNDKVNIGSVGYCATYCILPPSRGFDAEVDVRPLQNARENLSRFRLPDQRSIRPQRVYEVPTSVRLLREHGCGALEEIQKFIGIRLIFLLS